MLQAPFQSWNIRNRPVLVRADLNVPICNNTITSDFKLKAFEPTLQALIKQEAFVIIATHMSAEAEGDTLLSTQLLVPWFIRNGYPVSFAPDLPSAHPNTDKRIILLENLRSFPGEQEGSVEFARALAQLGDYYINDAFGVLHRSDASIVAVPALFDLHRRSRGLLVEKELRMLTPLKMAPKHPYLCMVGGDKSSTKLPLIFELLSLVDTMVVLPGLSNTYGAALQQPMGNSSIDTQLKTTCLQTIDNDHHRIILPIDYQVASKTVSGTTRMSDISDVRHDDIIVSIGPKTIALLQAPITHAHTIVLNGLPGFAAFEHTQLATKALLTSITQATAHTLLCGSDSIAAAEKYHFLSQFTSVSTGGGATLAYLAGRTLPGLQYI
jgi:phosphoglycerate kinase